MTTDYQDVVKALRGLADALEGLSTSEAASSTSAVSIEKTAPAAVPPEEEKVLRLEDVRAILADISRQGKTKEMKALLTRFGATKLSDVEPARYADLIKEAEVIRDA